MELFRDLQKSIKRILAPYHVLKPGRTINGVSGDLFTYTDRHSIITEQFNVLRTNIYSLNPDKPPHSIMLTSSTPSEGKTTTCANLAYALSLDSSKKTILIDCDMRRPELHNFFNVPIKPGFSDILLGNATIKDFIRKPVLDELFFIPGGNPLQSPSKIMNPEKISAIINELEAVFDFVIIDTPPVLTATDASIIGGACDAVLLVVKADVTPKTDVEDAYNALRSARAEPKGCILTNHHVERADKYGKYYFNQA